MPKRFLDEAMWMSDRVKSMPEKLRLHYANWIPLAEANGVFEANVHRIYSRVYSFLFPEMSIAEVQEVLTALENAQLVKTWEEKGKKWGYFLGIAKNGRLPDLRHLDRYKNLPPSPPFDDDGNYLG